MHELLAHYGNVVACMASGELTKWQEVRSPLKAWPAQLFWNQDALSEAVARLSVLERDKDLLKNTYVRASALKELENYLLERLSIQVCHSKGCARCRTPCSLQRARCRTACMVPDSLHFAACKVSDGLQPAALSWGGRKMSDLAPL